MAVQPSIRDHFTILGWMIPKSTDSAQLKVLKVASLVAAAALAAITVAAIVYASPAIPLLAAIVILSVETGGLLVLDPLITAFYRSRVQAPPAPVPVPVAAPAPVPAAPAGAAPAAANNLPSYASFALGVLGAAVVGLSLLNNSAPSLQSIQTPMVISSSPTLASLAISAPGLLSAVGAAIAAYRNNHGPNRINRWLSWAPALSIPVALLTGLASRMLDFSANLPLNSKLTSCGRQAYLGSPGLAAVNYAMQLGIKVCAPIFLLPTGLKLLKETYDSNAGNYLAKFLDGLKKTLSVSEIVFTGIALGLGLTHPLYQHSLGLKEGNFDSSGHVMLATVLSSVLASHTYSLANKSSVIGRALLGAWSGLYAFGNWTLLNHTINKCHTLPEIVTGFGWGAGIASISSLAKMSLEHFIPSTRIVA